MQAWLRELWSVALLRTDVFARLAARPDVFLRGFLVIVVVALAAGLPSLALDLVDGVQAAEPADSSVDRLSLDLPGLAPLLEQMGVPAAERDQILAQVGQGFELGQRIATDIAALPTVLPQPAAAVFQAVGGWASRPFADGSFPLAAATLGGWLGYGVWVMLSARLLGGRGGMQGFFGVTALFALPHLLLLFGRVPILGGVLGVIAFLWGAAIYVKATAVSQRLSVGRAFLAVISPLLVVIVLIALLLPVVLGTLAFFVVAGA